MDKRLAKRHKRQVARAKLRSKSSEPDVRTHGQIEAARDASRPETGRGPFAKFARAVRSKFTGSKETAGKEDYGIEHVAITANDSASITFSADLVATKFQGASALGIRMSGDSGREISADTQTGAETVSSIRARPRTNEANVPEVARILRERLNMAGPTWQNPEICSSPKFQPVLNASN